MSEEIDETAIEGSDAPVEAEEEPEMPVGDESGKEDVQDEDEEDDGVDLKAMADDYAKYLIVNSKQDVSSIRGARGTNSYGFTPSKPHLMTGLMVSTPGKCVAN